MEKKLRKRLPLAIAAALVAGPGGVGAVTLPPTVPLVQSYVNAQTSLGGTITLTGFDSFYTTRSYDYDYVPSTQRNVAAAINRPFTQWDGSTVTLSGYANSDFGVNRVAVASSGAAAPNRYQTFGSIAPDQTYADTYIGNLWNQNLVTVYDSNNVRNVVVTQDTNYHFDANTNDLVFDVPGGVFQPSWSQGSYYFVPNQPEVTVDLQAQRSVTAYSRWEDLFYFRRPSGSNLHVTGGVATFTLSIDGTLTGDYSGYYQLMVRDWLHKDSYNTGDYLAYQYANTSPNGTDVSSTVEVVIPFTFGEPNYVKSELWSSLWGEGDIDLSHTVKIESVTLPEDVAIFSYGAYLNGGGLGFEVLGGIDGNTIPGGAGGFFNSGGGGNPVPVPGAVWMFGSGVAALAIRMRRRAA